MVATGRRERERERERDGRCGKGKEVEGSGEGKTKRNTRRENEEERQEREGEREREKGTPACLGRSKAKPTNSRQFEAGGMPAFLVRSTIVSRRTRRYLAALSTIGRHV